MKTMSLKAVFRSLSILTLLAGLCPAFAQTFKLGGQMGGVGAGSSSGMGMGVFMQIEPYETVGLRIDGTFAYLGGTNYFATSPMLIFFVPTSEEFRAGFMAGGGFYNFDNAGLRFGVGAGASAEFLLAKNLSVGGLVQLHNVFNVSSNIWNVFLTLNFTFGDESGGWNW